MNLWLVLALVIEGFAVAAWLLTRLRPRLEWAFVLGFNVMLPVTALYVAYGSAPGWRLALVLAMVGVYLARMNWVIFAWSSTTALDKLDGTLDSATRQVLAFFMANTVGWAYCLPFWFAARRGGPVDGWDVAALAVYLVGTAVHAAGDTQKRRFKARPDTKGKVLDEGLWRYSRHPNYFGDFLIYVSFALFAAHPAGWVSPLTNWLQYRFDAIPKNEQWAAERYGEAWTRYAERTHRFVPWPPR